MPQKPLKVAKKIQKPTGNRHGKKPNMKKGEQADRSAVVLGGQQQQQQQQQQQAATAAAAAAAAAAALLTPSVAATPQVPLTSSPRRQTSCKSTRMKRCAQDTHMHIRPASQT
jgi:hypothetical protein